MKKQWLKYRLGEWADLILFTPFYILIFIIGVIMIMTGYEDRRFLND